MGGSHSQEFMVMTDVGEDMVASCPNCAYAANLEKAQSKLGEVANSPDTPSGKPEEVATPGKKTIEDVAKFLGVSPTTKIKTLVYVTEDGTAASGSGQASSGKPAKASGDGRGPQMIVVLMRGDHTLNEAKFESALVRHTG